MQYSRNVSSFPAASGKARTLGLAALAVLGLAAAHPQAAQAQIVNGDFKTGTASGFTASTPSLVSIVTTYNNGVNSTTFTRPNSGHFAVLNAGAGANVYTTLSQTFTAAAGQTLSGSAFFDAGDYMPFDDNGYVKLLGSGQILFSSDVSAVSSYGATPWTNFSYTFVNAGTYTLQAGVANCGDNSAPSQLGLGGVALSATPAPEPSSAAAFAFVGLGALGLIVTARRRVRAV